MSTFKYNPEDYPDNTSASSEYTFPEENRLRFTKAEQQKLIAFIETYGRVPNPEEYKSAGIDNKNLEGEQIAWANNFINLNQDALNSKWTETGVITPGAGQGEFNIPSYINPQGIGQAGSAADEIYQSYLQGQKTQYEQGMQASQGAEVGMQSEMAGNRQALLDQMRNDRRTKLKSGLSSAQIANEEIQSLLMGQSNAQMIAGQYFDQRQGVQNQYALAPQVAREQAGADIARSNLSGSAIYTAGTADAAYQAYLYSRMTPEEKAAHEQVTP